MPGARTFTELRFWQRARQWSKRIFQFTRRQAFREDRRLVAQINDSSESVMANIAEGFGRGTQAEFITFLGYAIGSLNETQSHLCAAYEREYITKDEFGREFQEGTDIRKMIVRFVGSMDMPGSGVKNVRKVPDWSDQVWEMYERITGNKRPVFFATKGRVGSASDPYADVRDDGQKQGEGSQESAKGQSSRRGGDAGPRSS